MNQATRRRLTRASSRRFDWIWTLLLVYVLFEYVRPLDNALKFLSPLRLGGLVTLALALGFLLSKKEYLKQDRIHLFVLAFWMLVAFSTFYAPNNRASLDTAIALLWLFVAFVFPLNLVLTSPERVYRFFFWWIGLQALVGVHVITHGGHGPGSFLTDENDVGLALNMALPYAIYVARFPDLSARARLLLYGTAGLMLVAIGVSASRGAVVGLAVLVATAVLLSKRPIRNGIVALAVVVVSIAILVRYLPPAYVNDMQGIDDPNDRTADERLWSWSIGWVMYKENPVLGVGANNYQWTNHLYATKSPMYTPERKILGGRVAHSLYFTLLPELGTAGVIVFVGLLRQLYSRSRRLRSIENIDRGKALDKAKFELIGTAMVVSLVAYLVTGAFISVLYYPPFWHLVGMVAATYRVAQSYFNLKSTPNAA